jgi:DNA (cytosine-5)-methyltransferase 1
LGWEAAWLAEIEPFPSAVLAHHYPSVPNLGDMTTLPDRILSGEVEAPDLFCGGTPCQAFSVAGLRRSLDDARGNLSLTFCEIADAIDHVRLAGGKPASIVFWENVPGVLNTADNAFGCFLGALAGCDTAIVPSGRWTDAGVVDGPQRTVAWRTLDAQFFGLAQRRRRVFVVASARDGLDPAQVLLEWEGVRRDSATSREAGKGVARGAAPSFGIRSAHTSSNGWGIQRELTHTLDTASPQIVAQAFGGGQNCAQTDVSTALSAHPGGSRLDFQTETFVAHTLRGEGFDASEDGTGRGTPLVPVAHTLQTQCGWATEDGTGRGAPLVPVGVLAWQPGNVTRGAGSPPSAEVFPTLKSDHGRGASDQQPHVLAFDTTQITHKENRSNPKPGDPCHPLAAGAHAPAIAFSSKDHGADAAADLAPTLRAMNHADSHANGGGQMAVAVVSPVRYGNHQQDTLHHESGIMSTLPGGSNDNAGHYTNTVTAMQVRRLTPVECERLQGFPDDYTAIPWRGKPASECPDGPRYKALGNSWAVPVVRWIGRRIHAAL